jgi:sugar phosphate isomerase/epimerase
MLPLSRCAIHTITTKSWSLATAVDKYRAAGIGGVTVWRQALEGTTAKDAGAMIRDAGLRVPALCRGGFFPAKDAAGRQAAIDDNRRCIDEAAELGADQVVLVCGAVPGISLHDSRRMITEGIAAVAEQARAAKVHLAIEPLHPQYAADRSAVSTMRQAREICEQIALRAEDGAPVVGIACDVYHVWWDDALEDEIAIAGAKGFLHGFHICDWKVQQSDPLNDRGLMGEGCISLKLSAPITSTAKRVRSNAPYSASTRADTLIKSASRAASVPGKCSVMASKNVF